MAMDQYAQLYGKLRASTLARHFAINNRFRTNFILHTNDLQGPPANQVDRWNVKDHAGDNPLMGSGQLMTCLAIEHYLGRSDALPIIRALVKTLGSLYKFPNTDHFDGYILRWDPVLYDFEWKSDQEGQYSRAFYINEDRTYKYCTPLHDPRSRRLMTESEWNAASEQERQRRGEAYWQWLNRFRRWEVSMDELVGLIMGYDMIYRLVEVPDVQADVSHQVNNLGDYLAEHGYYLVRPEGGFNARGASGILPALEYPFSRVFLRITGEPYYIRNSFQAVMNKADVWKALEEPFNWWSVAGYSATVLLAYLGGFIQAVVIPAGLGFLFGTTGPFTAAQLGQIWAIYTHRNVFDVWSNTTKTKNNHETYDQDSASEFALAYALSLLSLRRRFDDYMNGSQLAGYTITILGQRITLPGQWGAWFPPFIGLTGLDDPEPDVRTAYLNWLIGRRAYLRKQYSQLDPNADDFESTRQDILQNIAFSSFASAVAVALDAGADEETELVQLIRNDLGSTDLPILPSGTEEGTGLGFMIAVALAWLHRKRRQEQGLPVTTPGFPELPDWSDQQNTWPLAAVPVGVLEAARLGTIVLPLNAIQRNQPLQLENDGTADLFYDNPVVERSPVPLAVLPDKPQELIQDREITVPESAGDVPTGIRLRMGDEYEIEASGRIWAGVLPFTGENGPTGWEDRIEYDRKFPLTGRPNGHPYCLLGKLGEDGAYFFIGENRPRERYLGLETRELFLRINDDSPGNGTGAFTCRIRVWGVRLQIVDFKAVPFATIFVPSVWFRVLSEINRRARITLTVSKDGGSFYVVRSEDPYGSTVPPEFIGDWVNREVPTNTTDRLFLWWLGKTGDGPNYHNNNGLFEFRIRATDEGGGESQMLATQVSIEWPPMPPYIKASVNIHDFGRLNLGTPTVFTFQITNEGSDALTISRVSDPAYPEFKIVNALPDTINPSDIMPLSIQFTPIEERAYSSEIQIYSNANNQPLLTLSMHGIGVDVSVQCHELASQLAMFKEDLAAATGADRIRILQQINALRDQMRQLGCGEYNG